MSTPELARIRVKNTLSLIANFSSKREFAATTGLAPAQITQITGKNATTNIGDVVARRIEAGCGKPKYWLDIDHEAGIGSTQSKVIEIAIDSVLAINSILNRQKMPVAKIDPEVYGNLLRNVITTSVILGRVAESQIESSLSLANIHKPTAKR